MAGARRRGPCGLGSLRLADAVTSNGTRLARAAAGIAIAFLAIVSISAQERPVPALLEAVSAPAGRASAADARPETVRAQTVTVNRAALAADALDVALTGGVVVRAELDRRETLRGGAEAWSGHVPGAPMSSVTLVAVDGMLQGSIRTLDASWSIEPSAGGPLHVVRQIDGSALPRELPPLEAPVGLAALAGDPPVMAADDGGTIDVLVLYTPGARGSAGGSDSAVQARIALGIAETNTAYANSGITPRLRLVGTQLLSYAEVGISADLSALQSNASVGTLRNSVGADLVSLIIANSTEACGVGYMLNNSAAYGYSVVSYHCISPNYSFGHELGHNMGSAHAPEDGGSGYYAYSYGYKHPSNLFRTVMAYDCPGGCPRVLHFSNPDVNYGGAPTGTAVQHDNARSIDQTASTVANFRQAVGSGTAPSLSVIGDVTIAEDAVTGSIGFTVADAETPASSLTVSASSSNTALVPNTAAALALGGSGSSRTLVARPAANQSGSTTITVTVSDGLLTASRTFTLTVTPVPDPPVVSRTPASATVAPGMAAQTTVTVTDVDTAGSALALGTSSSNTTLLPNANVTMTVSGTTANSRTFAVTMTPVPGLTGPAVVTLSALDGGTPVATTFSLTVAVMSPPVIAPVSAKSTVEDTPIAVGFTVSDADTPLASLGLEASSSDPGLVPASGLVLSGSGASRTLTITPAANATGVATITLAASDGVATATTSFSLTVTAVNDAPSLRAGRAVGGLDARFFGGLVRGHGDRSRYARREPDPLRCDDQRVAARPRRYRGRAAVIDPHQPDLQRDAHAGQRRHRRRRRDPGGRRFAVHGEPHRPALGHVDARPSGRADDPRRLGHRRHAAPGVDLGLDRQPGDELPRRGWHLLGWDDPARGDDHGDVARPHGAVERHLLRPGQCRERLRHQHRVARSRDHRGHRPAAGRAARHGPGPGPRAGTSAWNGTRRLAAIR